MMRCRRLCLYFVLLFIFQSLNIFPQLSLGGHSLLSLPAPALTNPTHLSQGLKSQHFLSGVGGVAFDKTAIPSDNLKVETISIKYNKAKPDGERLILIVNDKEVMISAYDWQFIPAANFAESDYYSCFTLFGKLTDKKAESKILKKGGKIMNYHPALQNTLMGLRIFQLDMLILRPESTDLPMLKYEYILGEGEEQPDLEVNKRAWNNFVYEHQSIQKELQQQFRSYVICDYETEISFDIVNDSLKIKGEPFYYCWRNVSDSKDYNDEKMQLRLKKEIEDTVAFLSKLKTSSDTLRSWAIAEAIKLVPLYKGNYNFYSSGTFVEMMNIEKDSEKMKYLKKYDTNSLLNLVLGTKIRMEQHKPEYLSEYSKRISSLSEEIRAINPAVWDASRFLMRYSAFFRYVKEKYNSEWKEFWAEIRNITPKPSVNTPTVFE